MPSNGRWDLIRRLKVKLKRISFALKEVINRTYKTESAASLLRFLEGSGSMSARRRNVSACLSLLLLDCLLQLFVIIAATRYLCSPLMQMLKF